MIALVTSTLFPNVNSYSIISNEERLIQTQQTVNKLMELDFEAIYIFDNSKTQTSVDLISAEYSKNPKIRFYHSPQYSFKNKGLNEAILILNNINKLPNEQEIFKISGRYYPNENFRIADFKDFSIHSFIGKAYKFDLREGTISTRAYAIKNSKLLEDLLVLSIEDMLSYSSKIRGLRSLINSIRDYFYNSIGSRFQISIEHSFARILKKKYRYNLLDKLNIDGYLAGVKKEESISE